MCGAAIANGRSSTVTRSSAMKNSREAEREELAHLVGEHVRVRPLAGVLGEVEVLGRPVLALPAGEELLVGGGRLDDAVEARHDLVDVAVEEDLEGLVLGFGCRAVWWLPRCRSSFAPFVDGIWLLPIIYHTINK